MKILIDICHPAHVHLFKNILSELKKNERYELFVTVKAIKSAKELLNFYNISYLDIGQKKDSIFSKGVQQLKYDWIVYKLVKKYKINFGLSSSITIPHVSRITNIKSLITDDDDDSVEPLFVKFGHSFCDYLLSPKALIGQRKRTDTIYYPGYHELAYLHPKRFSPDPGVLDQAGVLPSEAFFIMRFNVFKAHHDVGIKGLSLQQKLELVKILEPHGKIFITTERDIEPELEKFKLKISPEKIHSLMAYATMFLGDSQTMTSEAAVLGTPALKCNSFSGMLSVPNELEHRYNLCYSFTPENYPRMLEKLKGLMNMTGLKKEWQQRRDKMLRDQIDVTAFWLWFIENYRESKSMMVDNPEFWNRFK